MPFVLTYLQETMTRHESSFVLRVGSAAKPHQAPVARFPYRRTSYLKIVFAITVMAITFAKVRISKQIQNKNRFFCFFHSLAIPFLHSSHSHSIPIGYGLGIVWVWLDYA